MKKQILTKAVAEQIVNDLITSKRRTTSVMLDAETDAELAECCVLLNKQSLRLIKPHAVMSQVIKQGVKSLLESMKHESATR